MRNLISLLASAVIHISIFLGLILSYENIKIPPKKEKIISIKNIKFQKPKLIEKPKPKLKSRSKPKPTVKIKPKPKPKLVKKPRPKPKTMIKPKPKPKTMIKPKPRSIAKTKPKPIDKKLLLVKPKQVITRKIIKKVDENLTKPTMIYQPKIDLKAKYLKYNYKKILSSIKEAKYYPRRARKLQIEGEVKVKFLLKKDASIKVKEIISNKRFLKKAAKKTIQKASIYFPKPPKDLIISITLVYKLND